MLPTYLKRDDGSLYINPAKRHVRSFWLQASPNPVIAIPAGGTATARFPIDTQGHFEWKYTMFRADDPNILVNIFDPGTRRFLMNRPIHLSTIAGDAQRPFILPESYFLNVENGPRELIVEFTDLSGAPNNVELCLHGRRFYHSESPPDVQIKMRDFFQKKERTNIYWLTTQRDVVLLANQTLVGPAAPIFEATDEADTEVLKATMFPNNADFDFQLRELRSNRTLSNGFTHSTEGWGDGFFPFVYPESFLIERNYDVALDIRELSAAPQEVFLTFTARRLYYA